MVVAPLLHTVVMGAVNGLDRNVEHHTQVGFGGVCCWAQTCAFRSAGSGAGTARALSCSRKLHRSANAVHMLMRSSLVSIRIIVEQVAAGSLQSQLVIVSKA